MVILHKVLIVIICLLNILLNSDQYPDSMRYPANNPLTYGAKK